MRTFAVDLYGLMTYKSSMNLMTISLHELRSQASKAAHRLRHEDSELIRFIQAVDLRMAYKDWGYQSLHQWVEEELKLCDGSVHLRIAAARLLNEFPQIAEKIDQGILSISTVSLALTFFNENKITDSLAKAQIFTAIEGLSKAKTIRKLFEISGKRKNVQEGAERVSADSFKLTIEISEENLDKLKELKRCYIKM